MSAPAISASSRASAWEWMQAWLFVANLIWTILRNGGYGARVSAVTTLLLGVSIVLHAITSAVQRGSQPRIHPASWCLLPFLAYALGNVLWVTPVPWLGWRDWLGWAQLFAVFWIGLNVLRHRGPRRLVFFALVAVGLVEVVLGCYQRFVEPEWRIVGSARGPEFWARASGSFSIPNSLAGFLLLLLPATAALSFRRGATATGRIWWGWVTMILLFGLGLTLSRGAWLCLVLALPLWPWVMVRGTWLRRLGLAALVFGVSLAVGALVVANMPKARERFGALVAHSGELTRPILWRAAWHLYRTSPLVGSGAGSFNVRFEQHRPEGFRDEPMWPHNDYLNTLSDYGAVGLLLALGAGVVVTGCCGPGFRRRHGRVPGGADSWLLGGMATGLLAFALQAMVEFHLKIPALVLTAGVFAAFVVRFAWSDDRPPCVPGIGRRLVNVVVAVACGAGVLVFVRPMLLAEALRSEARTALDELWSVGPGDSRFGIVAPSAQRKLALATQMDPSNAQAWSDLAFATVLLSHVESTRSVEFGRSAEIAADRALALSEICSDFWVRRGMARDLQGWWVEAERDFQQAVKLAPSDANVWYYYADHLARLFAASEAAEGALDYCLRLDPVNHAGLALRQRLAIKKKAP